jgi:hypothetical protein
MTLQIIFKLLYWSWIVTEVLVLAVTRTRSGGGEVRDRGSLGLLWVVIFASITAGMWVGATYRPAAIHGAPWLGFVIVSLLALGLLIRWSAIYTLGRAFSANVAIHATQQLNRSRRGRAYRRLRWGICRVQPYHQAPDSRRVLRPSHGLIRLVN